MWYCWGKCIYKHSIFQFVRLDFVETHFWFVTSVLRLYHTASRVENLQLCVVQRAFLLTMLSDIQIDPCNQHGRCHAQQNTHYCYDIVSGKECLYRNKSGCNIIAWWSRNIPVVVFRNNNAVLFIVLRPRCTRQSPGRDACRFSTKRIERPLRRRRTGGIPIRSTAPRVAVGRIPPRTRI